MARGDESTFDLFIRLGLSYEELESGFVDAERTIRDNMTRLSRENRIIDLQARVAISGLDETADAEQILQIRTNALNRQLEHQRDRVRLATAELTNMRDRTGENSDQTQRARLVLEQERLALAQLEEQLASLTDTQDDSGDSTDDLRGRFDALAARAAPLVAGLTAIVGGLMAAGNATKSLIKDWQDLQQQAYSLNMSVAETGKFLRQLRLAGSDIGDFEGYIHGITDAYTKGEKDDPEFIALGRYGAQITDATGKLKNFREITESVYQAYLKAKAAGEEIEFLQMTGGESGIKDAIQLFERYAEAKVDAAKILDADLDPQAMHKADRSLNLMTEQFNELGSAVANIVTPVTTDAFEELFQIFKAGTKSVNDNTEAIREWGGALVAATFDTPELRPLGLAKEAIKALLGVGVQEDAEKTAASINKVTESVQTGAVSWGEYRKAIDDTQKSWGDFRRETDSKRGENPLNQTGWKRLKDLKTALEDVRLEIDYFKQEYKKSLAELDLEERRALDAPNYLSLKEEEAIRELYAAKREQLEQERADRLSDIRESVAEADRTAFENKLAALDKEVEAWISAGMSETEALQLAEQKKLQIRETYVQKAQEMLQEAADKEYALTHDALGKQIYDIERWKQAQLEKAQTAEEVSATIADAAMKEAEAFKRAIDQMQDAVRSIQDDIARKTMSPKAYDEYAAQKKYREYLEKYPKSVADEWFRVEMARIGKKAADEEEHYRKAIAAEEERYRQARQRGDDAERRVIENPYTKSPGLGTSPLVNADSRALAAMGVLEKYGISVEELQKELNSTATAKEAYQNILQRLNDKMRETSGELGDATTEATNGIGNLGDAVTEGADKITSAAETVRRAFEYLAEIEEENARRKRDFQPEDEEPKIPVIYGNEDTFDPTIPPDNRIPIIYGNEEDIPFSTFEEPMQTAAEKIREFADNMDSAPIENFQQEVTNSAGATQNLADAATTAGTSTNALAEKMLQTADMLDALREKIANMPLQQPPQQPQQYDNMSDAIDDALKATATIGELTALGGLATLQPQIALLGTGIEALANTAQTLRDLAKHVPAQPTQPATPQPATPQPQPDSPTSVDLSEIQTTLTTISQTLNTIVQEPPVDLAPLQEGLQRLTENPALAEINTSIQGMSTELSAKLAEIAQGISALAQSAGNNRQPPQVNVNVSPNINLGGAYVFDDMMKQQLTDDIATEVADAVTSAVQTATKQADYGYGN